MEEQLPIPLDNNQANDQQNLVVQPYKEMPKEVKKITCIYVFAVVIFGLKLLFYIFLWFLSLVGSAINYNYKKHTYDVDKKYFSQFNAFLFPNLILSGIIICVGAPYLYHRCKITLIINILLITIKIILFIYFYKCLKKIFYLGSDPVLPKISLGIEICYISIIVILEMIKIIFIR